ncbi:MAG: DUF4835 family protein [Bacteroidales bacterium]
MKIRDLIIVLALVACNSLKGQELNCMVRINPPQTVGTSVQFYQDMQSALFEFMNTKSWTNNKFEAVERIECSILINITGVTGTRYVSTIQVISNRPVYGTNLQSPMFNYKEDDNLFEFDYLPNQKLEFNENRHVSNLTSVLAFYAFIIIGYDYDSYALEGGTEYFQKAQKVLNNAQNSNEKGWRAFEARKQDNRYFLIENLLNSKYSPFRRANYRYHRLGLDTMYDHLDIGRNEITESLKFYQKVYRLNPNLFIIKLFFDAKFSEIINIYSGAFSAERVKAYNILKEIDPAHLTQYEKLTAPDAN